MVFILYRVLLYVSPPIDQYLKFKNHCSLLDSTSTENNITIEDHDQGHLYTNLEVPRLTCPGRGSNPGLPRGKRAL